MAIFTLTIGLSAEQSLIIKINHAMTISTKPWCFWKAFFKKNIKTRICMSFLHSYRDCGLWVHAWPRGDACCCVGPRVTLVGYEIGLFEDHGQVISHEGLSVIVNGNNF